MVLGFMHNIVNFNVMLPYTDTLLDPEKARIAFVWEAGNVY